MIGLLCWLSVLFCDCSDLDLPFVCLFNCSFVRLFVCSPVGDMTCKGWHFTCLGYSRWGCFLGGISVWGLSGWVFDGGLEERGWEVRCH
ncbi:hypothetical protein BKA61DRAFT_614422 [Leptodontidium sp. MPI-SDFR-AT-0119]|nr:hypothetical protein BKA61DRAFT_614422 [Leptodontidium sp. MPI-SDFR-AT-0119]